MLKYLEKAKEKLETSLHFMEVLKIDNPLAKINAMDALLYVEAEIRSRIPEIANIAESLKKENIHYR